jgi:hypothetical protein
MNRWRAIVGLLGLALATGAVVAAMILIPVLLLCGNAPMVSGLAV